MTEPIDIKRIKELIPHRFPILLVDRVVEYELGKSISAYKNVTNNESFFEGHFPKHPVMPGVLIVEAMAQTAAVLAGLSDPESMKGRALYFLGFNNAKFRKTVVPGDRLDMNVEIVHDGSRAKKLRGEAFVDGVKVAEVDMTAAPGPEM